MKANNFHLLMYVIIPFMGILPVHKTMAAVRYGSFSLFVYKKTYYFANRPHIFNYVEGIKIIAQRNWILLLGKSIQLLIVFSYIAELQCNTSSYQRIEITKWNTSIMKTIDAGLLTCHQNSREMRTECEDLIWFSCSDCVMFERAWYPFTFGCWFSSSLSLC